MDELLVALKAIKCEKSFAKLNPRYCWRFF
jgi:hypothetical protein